MRLQLEIANLIKQCLAIFVAGCLWACNDNEVAIDRPFRMGTTFDASAMNDVAPAPGEDILHLQFTYIVGDTVAGLGLLDPLPSPDVPRCVSVAPAAWVDDFSEQSRNDYIAFCSALIDRMAPAYFNMMAEANTMFVRSPRQWPQFLTYHRRVFEELKRRHPGVCIYSSLDAGPLQKVGDETDHVLQRLAALQLLEQSDLFVLSLPPTTIAGSEDDDGKRSLQQLLFLSDKPAGIFVSGRSGMIDAAGIAAWQSVFLSCHDRDVVFVVFSLSQQVHGQALWKKYAALPLRKAAPALSPHVRP